MSFEKVEANPLAVQILQQCAFLAAEGIVQEVFADLDPLEYDAAIDENLKYSLLRRDDKRGLLLMHRLVQTVLRAQLSEADQKQIAEQVIGLLVAACPQEKNFENYTAWLKRSGEWLWSARSGQQWIEKWQLQSAEVGTLLNNMGYYLNEIGDYAPALPLSEEALTIREQVLGKQHPDYATSLNNLAGLYDSQGQFEKALLLYEEALRILTRVLGEKHPTTQLVKRNYEICRAEEKGAKKWWQFWK